jgi:hypothetical protein
VFDLLGFVFLCWFLLVFGRFLLGFASF